jgi:hypothetical protein
VKLRAWHLAISTIGGAVATLCCQWLLDGSGHRYGPFDRYVVTAVVKDPKQETYAALVDYREANSSSDVRAIWLGEGTLPAVGSTEPLQGWPVLISTSPIFAEQIGFAPDQRVIVSVSGPLEISNGTSHCYYDEVAVGAVCLNGPRARVIVTQ